MKKELSLEAIQTIKSALTCQLNQTKGQYSEIESKPFKEVADKCRSLVRTQLTLERAIEEINSL